MRLGVALGNGQQNKHLHGFTTKFTTLDRLTEILQLQPVDRQMMQPCHTSDWIKLSFKCQLQSLIFVEVLLPQFLLKRIQIEGSWVCADCKWVKGPPSNFAVLFPASSCCGFLSLRIIRCFVLWILLFFPLSFTCWTVGFFSTFCLQCVFVTYGSYNELKSDDTSRLTSSLFCRINKFISQPPRPSHDYTVVSRHVGMHGSIKQKCQNALWYRQQSGTGLCLWCSWRNS